MIVHVVHDSREDGDQTSDVTGNSYASLVPYERQAQPLHFDRNLEQIIKTLGATPRRQRVNAQWESIVPYLRLGLCFFPVAAYNYVAT